MSARLKRFFIDQRLRYRIGRQYTILFLATVFFMSTLCVAIISVVTKHENSNMSRAVLEQISASFADKMQNMESLVNVIYFYQNVCATIGGSGAETPYQELLEARAVCEVLRNMKYTQKDIDSISLYSLKNSNIYGISSKFGFQFDANVQFPDQAKLGRMLQTKGEMLIEAKPTDGETMFSACKLVMGDNAISPIGVIQIDFTMQALRDMEAQVLAFNHGELAILDQHGAVLYSTPGATPEQEVFAPKAGMVAQGGAAETVLAGRQYLVNIHMLERPDWTLVYLIPKNSIAKTGNFMGIAIGVIGLFSLILSSVLIFKLASKFTHPIVKITEHLKEIEKGNFITADLDYEFEDEIRNLLDGVNSMTEKIDTLINSEYEAKLLTKDAHFNMLVAQIKPHFLYNLMENISGIGYARNIPELSLITENLIDLLKYSIDSKAIIVPLSTEIEYILKYIEIQNYRFGNSIVFETDIPAELRGSMILKFTLQPVIENAIVHGLAENSYIGHVRVVATEHNGMLLLSVTDDGSGIEPEILQRLNSNTAAKERQKGSKTHIGILNVANRLKLYFGEQYGVRYESERGKGTKVTIYLPKRLE